jgi:hypothetical protein
MKDIKQKKTKQKNKNNQTQLLSGDMDESEKAHAYVVEP